MMSERPMTASEIQTYDTNRDLSRQGETVAFSELGSRPGGTRQAKIAITPRLSRFQSGEQITRQLGERLRSDGTVVLVEGCEAVDIPCEEFATLPPDRLFQAMKAADDEQRLGLAGPTMIRGVLAAIDRQRTISGLAEARQVLATA